MYLAFKPDDSTAQNNAIAAMEECLHEIRLWMIRDRLLINDDKTEFALIGTNAQLRKVSISTLRIGDAEVYPSIDPIRNLGVWIDNTFSMKPHVINTCKSALFHLHNIRRIRKYLSGDSTEKLIHIFVSSRLDYCNGLLYGLPKNLISKLQRLQNTAARIVYCMPTFCHITPLLFDLHWLPVKFRIDYKITVLLHCTAFKCLHNTAPHYLSSLLSVQMNSKHGLRSNNQFLLSRHNFKTLATIGDRAFIAAAPKLWNTLPLTIRNIDNFNLFKNKLNTFLFRQAFNDFKCLD